MLGVRRKYRVRRFFGSKVTFAVVVILLIVFAQAAVGMYFKAQEAREKRDLAQSELKRLEARESELQSDVSRLSNDRGVEAEIRDRFFVAKEGENVVIITGGEGEGDSAPQHTSSIGLWKKILSAVGLSGE